MQTESATLVTGATGYLGSLIVVGLLRETRAKVILPVRSHHTREGVLEKIRAAFAAEGQEAAPEDLARILTAELPAPGQYDRWIPFLEEQGVGEIVHSAGCLDYFDRQKLKEVNIDLTEDLIRVGKALGGSRFIYLSTAFSSGYTDGPIGERLHPEPASDPTEYTRSKREAEYLVAGSGLPFLIVRPSIVIGDSRDGHYDGKPFGIYQILGGYERLLTDRYLTSLHAVAPRMPLNLLHQDAFSAGFFAARRHLPSGSIFNLVSRQETLPTVRDLFELWMEISAHPEEVRFYPRLEEIPREAIDARQRMLIEFSEVNLAIAAHSWNFETGHLDRLRPHLPSYGDATLRSLRVCLERFAADSTRIQAFLKKYQDRFPQKTRIVEMGEVKTSLHQ
jgi:nucleoside-diphosphate-sugar epimerase